MNLENSKIFVDILPLDGNHFNCQHIGGLVTGTGERKKYLVL